MRPEMTLVICTRNREQSLGACLEAVVAMEGVEDCQVVVVDNGSTDATRLVVAAFKPVGYPQQLEYVLEPRIGLSRARNRGLREARGEFVLFTDDDCYPERGYLREARKVFLDRGVDYFGGRVLLHDPQDFPITIQDSTTARNFAPGDEIVPGVIHGANMGFRRNVFDKIGGFNVLLGAGTSLKCAEDTELIARASLTGLAGGYFPAPTVRHHHRRKALEAEGLMRAYDIGRGGFLIAMLGHRSVRWKYARRWWRSFSWRRRRALFREMLGAARFVLASATAMLLGRERVPRIPMESGQHD